MSKQFNPPLGFEESQALFESASQRARVATEAWFGRWLYCPNCGGDSLSQAERNKPAHDFSCHACDEQYELKSTKGKFGAKVVDGAYRTLCERLASDQNPNFAFLSYNAASNSVEDLFIVPKHFFIPDIIEARKPLAATARRAGWIGCNILLSQVPHAGKIHIISGGKAQPKSQVQELWRKTLFLRDEKPDARGWLIEVMGCCETIGKKEFAIDEVYNFERKLGVLYPGNNNVKAKIRQQLQVLRDVGYLDFVGRGQYRLK